MRGWVATEEEKEQSRTQLMLKWRMGLKSKKDFLNLAVFLDGLYMEALQFKATVQKSPEHII